MLSSALVQAKGIDSSSKRCKLAYRSLAAAVERRQFPWTSDSDRDDDDGPVRPPPRIQPKNQGQVWDRPKQPTPAEGWNRPTQTAQQPPWNRPNYGGQNPRPQPPRQPAVITITITKATRGSEAPASTVYQPQPSTSLTRQGTWSQPSSWGLPRDPLSPTPVAIDPLTIVTTTTDLPHLVVPFLTNCGGIKYVEDDVYNALLFGCLYKNKTQTVYESEYPKSFPNTQRFNFGRSFLGISIDQQCRLYWR